MCISNDCDYAWQATDCSDSKHYICQIEFKCPQGWISFDNSCYKLETTKILQRNVIDGDEYCDNTYQALLAIPNSMDEAVYLGEHIKAVGVRSF
jgi:hypothetical protein